jgi:hypothetical protein
MLRFALAMALVLVTLASARMQGVMAGGLADVTGFGALCSGERAPPADGSAAHIDCFLCNLPVAVGMAGQEIAAPVRPFLPSDLAQVAVRGHYQTPLVYRSRAPPSRWVKSVRFQPN